jgi:hypothetical protein
MKCYYHPNGDAVAVCKHCGRGLCHDCASEVGSGIACKGWCENEVRTLTESNRITQETLRDTKASFSTLPVSLLVMGGALVVVGYLDKGRDGSNSVFFITAGCAAVIVAAAMLLKIRGEEDSK